MGIDIYMEWKNQTEEEKKAQITGYSITAGNVGYLREAYHGEPYPTHFLVSEAFEKGKTQIPAKTLFLRLNHTLELAREREEKVYFETKETKIQEILKSYKDFVKLALNKESETGEPVTIIASY